MIEKNKFLLIFILLLPVILCAQQKTFIVSGKVVDAKGIPIESAYIYDLSHKNFTITDKVGEFKIKISLIDSVLTISHVAFYEKELKITKGDLSDKDLIFQIILTQKRNYLEGINVISKYDKSLFTKKTIWVYDYELIGEKILVLLKDTAKSELRLISSKGKVLDSKVVTQKNKYFLKDGLNNVYLSTTDSVFQIVILNNKIGLYYGFPLSKYNQIVSPCVANTKEYMYFKTYKMNGKLLRYFFIHKATKEKDILVDIFDKENYLTLLHNKHIRQTYAGINYMGDIWIPELKQVHSYIECDMYINKIPSKSIYSPLISLKDSLYVFDLIDNSLLVFYSDGTLKRQVKIDFQNKKIYSIIADCSSQKFYALHLKKGLLQLDEINIKTGNITCSYLLKGYVFPTKIRIRKGIV